MWDESKEHDARQKETEHWWRDAVAYAVLFIVALITVCTALVMLFE